MPTILDVNFGREFFGWPEALEKTRPKYSLTNSPSKFAEEFASNFPKIRRTKIKKFTPIPLCITPGPTYPGIEAEIWEADQRRRFQLSEPGESLLN